MFHGITVGKLNNILVCITTHKCRCSIRLFTASCCLFKTRHYQHELPSFKYTWTTWSLKYSTSMMFIKALVFFHATALMKSLWHASCTHVSSNPFSDLTTWKATNPGDDSWNDSHGTYSQIFYVVLDLLGFVSTGDMETRWDIKTMLKVWAKEKNRWS